MKLILQKAVFQDEKLKSYINRITVNDLNRLSEPCFYPIWVKHYHELLHLTNLIEDDIKQFSKRFFKETKISKNLEQYGKIPMLLQDSGSNFLIILMHYFLTKKDIKTYSSLLIYYVMRQYGNFLHQNLKYCKPEVFIYNLNHLNPSHLFSREKTIANALYHLAMEMKKKFTGGITQPDPDIISIFVFESRSRVAQSLRSFLEGYYKYEKEGAGIGETKTTEEGDEIEIKQLEQGSRVAELVSQKICVFKETNQKAIQDARSLTKINSSIATLIIKELENTEYADEVKFIIELFLKDAKTVKNICGKNFLLYVKSLMSLKKTNQVVFFKQKVNELLLKILNETKLNQKYNKLTAQTKFQINSFLSFYLTMYTRSLIC